MLNLSFAARIISVMINILPKFLYFFQCIPIFLQFTFFHKIYTMIWDFIWSGKTPRIRKQFLQRPRALGRMALSNFRFYYWAANIRIIHFWRRFDSCSSKIVHRAHYTKVRLSKMYKDIDPTCDICQQAPTRHVHMFWSCPTLKSFWVKIF